jgi:phenylpropionate dioxygenase-like ring-hydroxylating dioxygenase large terminal subunit
MSSLPLPGAEPHEEMGSTAARRAGESDRPKAEALARDSRDLVDRPLDEALSILPECYSDPGFYALEVERLFRRGWICAGRASQIPNRGDFFCIDMFDEKLIVVRGEDGAVRALSPVCRHRGAIVAEGAGRASNFRCPYHKWTYDLGGRLVKAPLMEPRIVKGGFDLVTFGCEVWLGWIMVNLDGLAEPLAPRLKDLTDALASWRIETMVPLCEPVVYQAELNWKIACDNQGESYHLIGPHALSVLPYADPRDSVFTSDLATHAKSWFPSHSEAIGPVFGERLPGIPAEFNGTWSYNVFPNHLFVVTDDFVVWQHQKIAGVGRFRHEMWVLGYPEIRNNTGMRKAIQDVRNGVIMVEGEDQGSFRSVWKGVCSSSARPGPFAKTEMGTWFWQRWLTAALCESR